MSTLGSSVINKSGKKFAPKAPVRRPATASLTQKSTRASVDRQNPFQAPQPQSQPQSQPQLQPQAQPQFQPKSQAQPQPELQKQSRAKSQPFLSSQATQRYTDTSHTPLRSPKLQSPQEPIPAIPVNGLYEDRQILISVSSRNAQSNPTATTELSPTSPVIPQKRIREEHSSSRSQDPAVEGHEHNTRAPDVQLSVSRDGSFANQTLSSTSLPEAAEVPIPATPVSISSTIPSAQVLNSPSPIASPSTKRRRIERHLEETVSTKTPFHSDASILIPLTEVDGTTGAQTESEIGATSTLQQPTTVQKPVKISKPKLSAKAKGKRRVEQNAADPVADVGQMSSGRASKLRKLRKSTEKRGQQSVEDVAAEIVASAVKRSSIRKKGTKRRNTRAITPEGAADVRIVPSQVKMSDLCKNGNTGKKSTRQTQLEELDKAEAARKEQQQLEGLMGAAQTSSQSNDPPELAEERLERLATAREEVSREVPNTIVVDGQIQIDETSLQLDRHANAAIERDAEQLEGVDESELTRPTNAGSWMKRDKCGQWNEQSTDMFFDGLRMFGTDFEMISKMFPGRTRRSVKLKFCKEEKLNLQKIKDTLMGATIPVNMEQFSKMSNTIYNDPKELDRDLAEDRKRLEAEQAAEKQAMDDIRMEREREAAAEGAAVADDSSAKENQIQGDGDEESAPAKARNGRKAKGQKKTRRGKNGSAEGQGEVLGPIEET